MFPEKPVEGEALLKLIANEIVFDEIQIQEAWRQIVERRLSAIVPEGRSETFIRSAILFYARSPSIVRVTADAIIAKAGFSRSTFFRVFGSFNEFQIKMYQYLCEIAAAEYLDLIKQRSLNPAQLADLTLSVIYSSNIAIPNAHFLNMVRGAPELKFSDFNKSTQRLSVGLHDYIIKHKHLGYAEFDVIELHALLETLDFDIFNQRVSNDRVFPSAEQAKRLRKMFLGFISDN